MTVIDASFGLFEGALIALYVIAYRPHILIALHVVLFWAFMVVFTGISNAVIEPQYDALTYIIVHAWLLTYLLVAMACGLRWKRKDILPAIERIPSKALVACMGAWLAFRFYLLTKYGIASFQLLGLRESIGAAYWEVALVSLLWYPALGALFAFVVQATIRPRLLFSLPAAVALAVLVFAVLFNEVGGTRRFMLMVAALVFLVAIYRRGFRASTLVTIIVGSVLTVMAAEQHQRLRANITDQRVVTLLQDGDISGAAVQYVLIGDQMGLGTLENLQERTSPVAVLYAITEHQHEHGTTTGGKVLAQSFENATPAALLAGKTVINADEHLAEAFDTLPRADLASGVLAMFQAEISSIAYLFVPLLVSLLIAAYSRWLATSRSRVLVIVLLGASVLTAQTIEHLLDSLLVNARDVLFIALVVWVVGIFRSLVRYAVSR